MKHQFTNDQLSAAIVAAYNKANAESRQSWDEEVQGTCPLNCASLTRVAEYFLTNLPEPPPPVVHGKTPGQWLHEASRDYDEKKNGCYGWKSWEQTNCQDLYEQAASAVLAAFGNKHPLATLAQNQVNLTPEQSAVVEQVLQSEVFGKPAEIPWTPWHGGPCPLKDEEVEEWEHKHVTCSIREVCKPSKISWKRNGTVSDIIAYRVTKWKEGFGPDSVESESEAPAEVAAPSTFTAHGKEWNIYNLGDSGPEDSERYIEIIDQDGHSGGYVKRYPHVNNWNITKGWRYADDETSGKSTSEVIITPEWTPAVGDVVTLKSGGPKMTVVRPSNTEEVDEDSFLCEWFNRAQEYGAGHFQMTSLTKAD